MACMQRVRGYGRHAWTAGISGDLGERKGCRNVGRDREVELESESCFNDRRAKIKATIQPGSRN